MTAQLQSAIHQMETLPESEQNALAHLIMQEIEWDKSFEQSQDLLSNLADDAMSEFKAGKTKPLSEL
jgi:hypothetical protein